jgi:HTH-type transcriptional regulator, competence development regulator
MQNKETFGAQVRKLREEQGFPLRKVAAELDLDPSTLSKIERNERFANRHHIKKLSTIFHVDETGLLITYLSDKIAIELMNEECSHEILQAADQKIKLGKQKKQQQASFNFPQ